jgi:hypothetical protein
LTDTIVQWITGASARHVIEVIPQPSVKTPMNVSI